MTASRAPARLRSRSRPPLRSSPCPSSRCSPSRRERAASARLNEANRELERAVRETENAERTLRVYAGERPGGGTPAGAPAALPPAPLRDRNGGVSPLLAGEVLERAAGSNWIEDSVGGEECGP